MSVLTRPAVLLAGVTLTAGLLVAPGAAWAADTTTSLTAAQMRTALRAVATASTTAGAGGWAGVTDITVTFPGQSITVKDTLNVDPVNGRFGQVSSVTGEGSESRFAAEGQGYWTQAGYSEAKALKMMGKSGIKYVFAADKKRKLSQYLRDSELDMASMVDYFVTPGTKTVHDDGSVDYKVTENAGSVTVVMHTTGKGVLTAVDMSATGLTGGTVFTYAPQTVTLPAAAESLDAATVNKGVAYLDMARTVQAAAQNGAASTRKAAKGRTVKVATLRKLVRKDVTGANRSVGVTMVNVKDVTGGVRVSATNPWTRKSVAYTVKASGRKVVVKKV
ncbi:hypothetical protein [Actinoplanes couchii]|nr:hypothetical protein [Actinoplanes couchii]MDR6321324.1 hypothetical protein [Actinoplanes couchii]